MEVNISFRVSADLRDAAQKKAQSEGVKVSDVLRDALRDYIDTDSGES